MLLLEHANAATEKVDVVEAFFENYAGLENSMPLIVVVDHQDFVSLVLVDAQLSEDLVSLDVFSWETYRISNVRLRKVTDRTQVEQDNLGQV